MDKKLYLMFMALVLAAGLVFSGCSADSDEGSDDKDDKDGDKDAAKDDDDDNDDVSDDDDTKPSDDDDDNDDVSDDDDNNAADDDDNDIEINRNKVDFKMRGLINSLSSQQPWIAEEGATKVRWAGELLAVNGGYIFKDPATGTIQVQAVKLSSSTQGKALIVIFPDADALTPGYGVFDPEANRSAVLLKLVFKRSGYSLELVSQEVIAECDPPGFYNITNANSEIGDEFAVSGSCPLVEPFSSIGGIVTDE